MAREILESSPSNTNKEAYESKFSTKTKKKPDDEWRTRSSEANTGVNNARRWFSE